MMELCAKIHLCVPVGRLTTVRNKAAATGSAYRKRFGLCADRRARTPGLVTRAIRLPDLTIYTRAEFCFPVWEKPLSLVLRRFAGLSVVF
jgi:hypothetical protein